MRRSTKAALLLALLGCADPALGAEAVTYKGTLGELPIILEIGMPTEKGERLFGRYSLMSSGTDIPFGGLAAEAGALRLEEEAPCTQETCILDETGTEPAPPIGADWVLTTNGTTLSGTRTDRATGATMPVRLDRRASRRIETTNTRPLDAMRPENSYLSLPAPHVLTPASLPYDFLKLDWPRRAGEEIEVGGVELRMETDPRNGVESPAIVTLGGPDTGPVDRYLLQLRLQAELPSFSCRSQAYDGFGWGDWHLASVEDDDANVPSIGVEHVSPRLIGIAEAGSFFCGGAHPANFLDHLLVDVKTGVPIVPETMLAGWIAHDANGAAVDPATNDDGDGSLRFGPSQALIDYVRSRRLRFDESMEADCEIDELVATNLGVYFTQEDLVFTLRGLRHAIFACTDDLLAVPLADARPLLTAKAAGYFAVLDR